MEIVGGLAVAVSVLIYLQKDTKRVLLYKGITDTLWIIHYLLAGGYTGAAVTSVALIREIVFFKNNSRGGNNKRILLYFLIASVICAAITWQSLFSILPAVGSLLSVVSFWSGKPMVIRLLAFPISACFLTYGISHGSVTMMINESLVILSSLLGLIFVDLKKAKAKA